MAGDNFKPETVNAASFYLLVSLMGQLRKNGVLSGEDLAKIRNTAMDHANNEPDSVAALIEELLPSAE
ncbi:MAG: hypothetical protein AAGH53_05810 [Pseudomonadota bacterium]